MYIMKNTNLTLESVEGVIPKSQKIQIHFSRTIYLKEKAIHLSDCIPFEFTHFSCKLLHVLKQFLCQTKQSCKSEISFKVSF